jgi:TPP-dependent indolepyruvate ferredoxin oxidoreductase alpha subunit
VGLFRPITLWPFPAAALAELAPRLRALVVVELSAGQMVEDVRLAVGTAAPVFFHGRMGGMVPTPGEVVDAVRRAWSMTAPVHRWSAEAELAAAEEPDPLSLIELGGWRTEGLRIADPSLEVDPIDLLYREAWRDVWR